MNGEPADDVRTGSLRITEIIFRAGNSPSAQPLHLPTGNVTILVGPNNAGKSLALREIEFACTKLQGTGLPPANATSPQVVLGVALDLPQAIEEVMDLMRPFKHPAEQPPYAPGNEQFTVAYSLPNGSLHQGHIVETLLRTALGPSGNHDMLRNTIMPVYTVRLDGRTRFNIPMSGSTDSLVNRPTTHLQVLFREKTALRKLQDITHDAFGRYIMIDASTEPGKLFLRMSDHRTQAEYEHLLTEDAAHYFAQQPLLATFSDGVQAFVALTGTVIGSRYKVILIDEPEAFLPPPIARRLGAELTRVARERGGSLVVATHSADFVMGCVEESNQASVVRLTYQRETGVATARLLSATDLTRMMRHPLLRSTGVFRSLFHEAAVVTEGDSDRVFYDEMNQRLLRDGAGRGMRDTLFLNALGWSTEHEMIRPMRRVGIPVAAILDMESLDDRKRNNWPQLLDACQVPEDQQATLEAERGYLRDLIVSTPDGHDRIKDEGLAFFVDVDRVRAQRLFHNYALYGLFIVDVGELEGWLKPFGNGKHANEWMMALFNRIGLDDQDDNYVRPGPDDVWSFIDSIAAWVSNTSRLGTD